MTAAPSVTWPQSCLRVRPSTTGLASSSAMKLLSPNAHCRVWALGFFLPLAKLISAIRIEQASFRP